MKIFRKFALRRGFVLAMVALGSQATADVINVRGPIADFGEINAAVAAAHDGDVLRIWPGTYLPFGINNKSLVLASPNGTTTVHVSGTLRVRNLAPERVVSLTGINAVGTDGEGLIVSDCIGSVRIRDGVFDGASAPYPSSPWNGALALRVLTSDDVVSTACSMQGGNPELDGCARLSLVETRSGAAPPSTTRVRAWAR